MKAGDVVGGYTILEDFKVVGAGLSMWTFAERGGRQFFIKQFLSPTYPDDAAPGSDKTKARKRARCEVFAAHHMRIKDALAPLSSYGGNLIVTLDFFRQGAKFYKITERVDVAGLSSADVAGLDFERRLVLLKTVAHSLKILHDLGLVHSDLKPSNVLIKRTELGFTTKLIDFDSAYFAGSPPLPDEIVGTLNYYSPELVSYIQEAGVAPGELSTASDVFTLGLIYAEYLTGAPPRFDSATHRYASVAARSGEVLRLVPAAGVPAPVIELVEQMLRVDPAARPSVAEVHAALMRVRGMSSTRAEVLPPAPTAIAHSPSVPAVPTTGGLRGKGLRTALARAVPPPPPEAGPERPSERRTGTTRRLLGKLVERIGASGS